MPVTTRSQQIESSPSWRTRSRQNNSSLSRTGASRSARSAASGARLSASSDIPSVRRKLLNS